jgi:DNA uptake protein ComE-like DNA-binding protein
MTSTSSRRVCSDPSSLISRPDSDLAPPFLDNDTLAGMPSGGKKREPDPEAWLLQAEEAEKAERSSSSNSSGAETRQWLAIPSPVKARRRDGEATENGDAPKPAAPALGRSSSTPPKARRAGLAGLLTGPRERRLESKLRRAREKIDAQQHEISEMKSYIERLEDKARKRRVARAKTPRTKSGTGRSGSSPKSPKAKSKAPTRSAGAPAHRSRSSRSRAASKRKIALNMASFEDLRAAGLSVTQSARLIAYRDVRGGYQSIEDLDDVPGLSSDTLTDLKIQAQL